MATDPNVERARRRFHRNVVDGVTRVGEALLGGSQRRAPLEEGSLRASGELEVEETDGAVIATVSFNEVYALAQHEGIDFEHPLAGEAKYLENELTENLGRYEAVIAASAGRGLR